MIHMQFDLTAFNTLRLSAKASAFATFSSENELLELLQYAKEHQQPVKILGGGSNILLTRDVNALVLQSAMKSVTLLEQNDQFSRVIVDAGLSWHEWVLNSIQYGHGLENLALIPGTVGAAPVQNIGAYGVEVGEFLESVEGFDLITQEKRVLTAKECRFAYRDSIFKQELSGRFVITRVLFALPRAFNPVLSYGPLAQCVGQSPRQLIDAVCDVRQSKLPDPKDVPNAGSFFKNPIVAKSVADSLKAQYSQLPVYAQDNGSVKLAAGWLIEQAGWKGRWLGNARMHDQQALVLTTNGKATYQEIELLCAHVIADIKKQFNVELEPEPQAF